LKERNLKKKQIEEKRDMKIREIADRDGDRTRREEKKDWHTQPCLVQPAGGVS